MSQENVELVRSTFDAITRRDYREAARGFHADAVWQNTAQFPGPKSCVGVQAIVDFWATLVEPFDENASSSGIERVAEAGDIVVLGVHSVGRGKSSGLPVDVRWGASFHMRDGKISRVHVYGDWPTALKDAGLAE